jgi:predicted CoA-binding protein
MHIDQAAAAFLSSPRIAVAGVSRSGQSPANAIATRLRQTDHQVFAINPSGREIDGHPSYATLSAVPDGVDAVVVVTPPLQARALAAEAGQIGATWIWFHQGFGPVSYDDEALRIAHDAGLKVIHVGCPMMYCAPDGLHRCARSLFRWVGRIPKNIEA